MCFLAGWDEIMTVNDMLTTKLNVSTTNYIASSKGVGWGGMGGVSLLADITFLVICWA